MYAQFLLVVLVALVRGMKATALPSTLLTAPHVVPFPHVPKSFQPAPLHARSRVCAVATNSSDAGPAILEAVHQCNNGGTVYLGPGDYVIATPLDLTFLNNIDIAIFGTILFKDDPDWWTDRAFSYTYQSASLFGGHDVNIYGNGKGVIDGRGQTWWSAMVSSPTVVRPCLFGTDGLHRATISGITMLNPPGWFNFISNSSDILISDFTMTVEQLNSSAPAKNTDGWDTYRSSRYIIQNSVVVNNDDCVSFKPNSTDAVVQGLNCTGSHGISVGSLGQYQGEVDLVENVYVYNTTMTDCGTMARIKVWPGVAPGITGSTTGGGTGLVKNVTYRHLKSHNNDQALTLTQCYYAASQSICDEYPSELLIQDVFFEDINGTTSATDDPLAGSLICSSNTTCTNISAIDIHLFPPSGKNATYQCVNLDDSLLELNCV